MLPSNPQHPAQNPLFQTYKLKCAFVEPTTGVPCRGRQQIKQHLSAGLKVGDKLYDHPQDSEWGRCPLCKRTGMIVVEGPPQPEPEGPEGWTKIPEK
jgi:hypothetical protein